MAARGHIRRGGYVDPTLHTNTQRAPQRYFNVLGHGNPRAGMQYRVGIDHKGRVVHIYTDGERIVMHKPGHPVEHITPHVQTGGMLAPAAEPLQYASDVAALQQAHAGIHRTPAGDAQNLAHQAALQAAAQHFASLIGA